MPRLKSVVVGVDFGESARAAARWTVRHFAAGAEVTLVHAVDLPRPPSFMDDATAKREELEATLETGARDRMAALTAELDLSADRGIVRTGRAFQVLSDVADETDVDLIAIGEHGSRRGIWSMLGSTADRLLRTTKRPILLARSMRDAPPQRILAAIDESAVAATLLAWSALLGQRTGAEVVALHVVTHAIHGHLRLVNTERKAEEVEEALVRGAESWLARLVAAAPAMGASLRAAVVSGDAPYEILAAAQRHDADLIVMGSRGSGVLERALVGSVARAVLRAAPCPVLVVTEP